MSASSPEPGFRLSLLAEPAMQLALAIGAYFLTAATICGFAAIGTIPGINLPWFGLVGHLLITLAAISGAVWLTWRGDPRANSLGPIAVVLLVVAIFAMADVATSGDRPYSFWKMRQLQTLLSQSSMIAVAALGMTILIVSGGIDLSAGTNISLAATVLALVILRLHQFADASGMTGAGGSFAGDEGRAWLVAGIGVVAVFACLATSTAAGFVNGILVTHLKVVPFIVTLGTMSVFMGLNKLISVTPIRPALFTIPEPITSIVRVGSTEQLFLPLVPNVAWGVALMLFLSVTVWLLLEYTVIGRHVFAIGSSEPTARLCGINTVFTKTLAYALSGLFCGIAAIYLFGEVMEGNPGIGPGMELKVIAAVVIGGGSLSGGRGSVIGTLCGAALVPLIGAGCSMLELGNQIQDVIIGGIIVGAVAIDQVREGKITLLEVVDSGREFLIGFGSFGYPLRWPLDRWAEWLRSGDTSDQPPVKSAS